MNDVEIRNMLKMSYDNVDYNGSVYICNNGDNIYYVVDNNLNIIKEFDKRINRIQLKNRYIIYDDYVAIKDINKSIKYMHIFDTYSNRTVILQTNAVYDIDKIDIVDDYLFLYDSALEIYKIKDNEAFLEFRINNYIKSITVTKNVTNKFFNNATYINYRGYGKNDSDYDLNISTVIENGEIKEYLIEKDKNINEEYLMLTYKIDDTELSYGGCKYINLRWSNKKILKRYDGFSVEIESVSKLLGTEYFILNNNSNKAVMDRCGNIILDFKFERLDVINANYILAKYSTSNIKCLIDIKTMHIIINDICTCKYVKSFVYKLDMYDFENKQIASLIMLDSNNSILDTDVDNIVKYFKKLRNKYYTDTYLVEYNNKRYIVNNRLEIIDPSWYNTINEMGWETC